MVCKPSDVDQIASEIKTILNGLASGEINFSEDLEKVKTNLNNTFNINKQKNSFWTKSIRNYYFNHYKNWDFVTDFESMVNKISKKDIEKLAKKYFIKTPQIKAVLYPENY
ncbi:hypothetical protein JCM19274_5400 [Algibacter lectus]|uniref:Zinc protease pqqL n=1 Tax=Algibacter lectus TaxID=221126 RepID=A0A090X4F4_9FLAO|nr:hypothetical protein JCM19274_5400 [Algibacter lectus]